MEPTKLKQVITAVLFASEDPVSPRKLSAILDDVPIEAIHAAIDELKEEFKASTPSILVEHVAGGVQLSTNPEYAEYVSRIYSGKRKQRLSKAAMETLAIIAYKQSITRADVENVRGVGCGGVVTTLMERNLVRITGKAKVLGAPFLYGTTPEFLEYLGLNSLKDLPSMEQLEALLAREEEVVAQENAADLAPPEDEVDDASTTEAADPPADAPAGRVEGDVEDTLLGGPEDANRSEELDAEAEKLLDEHRELAGDNEASEDSRVDEKV